MLMIVLFIYVLAVFGCGFAWNMTSLLIFRAVQGMGMSIFPLSFSIVRDTFPTHLVPITIGIISSMFSIGVSLGLLGGGALIEVIHWQYCFFITGPVMLIVMVLVYFLLNIKKTPTTSKLDLFGTFSLGISILSILLALTYGKEEGFNHPFVITNFSIGFVFIIVFIFWERKVESPLVDMRLLTNKNIIVSYLSGFSIGVCMFGVFQILPFYLMSPTVPPFYGHELDSSYSVGLYLFPSTIIQLITSPIFGFLNKKIGPGKILASCLSFICIGYIATIFFHRTMVDIIMVNVVTGLGMSGCMVSMITLLSLYVPREIFGVATAMNTLFRVMGGSIGPVFFSLITKFYEKTIVVGVGPGGPITMAFTEEMGYIIVWIICSVIMGLTVIFPFLTKDIWVLNCHVVEDVDNILQEEKRIEKDKIEKETNN